MARPQKKFNLVRSLTFLLRKLTLFNCFLILQKGVSANKRRRFESSNKRGSKFPTKGEANFQQKVRKFQRKFQQKEKLRKFQQNAGVSKVSNKRGSKEIRLVRDSQTRRVGRNALSPSNPSKATKLGLKTRKIGYSCGVPCSRLRRPAHPPPVCFYDQSLAF